MSVFDVVIQIGNLQYKCNKFVLIEHSEYFRSLLNGIYKDSTASIFTLPNNFSQYAFEKIYELMDQKLTLNYDSELAISILAIADFLQVSNEISQLIFAFIKLTAKNALYWLRVSQDNDFLIDFRRKVLKICQEEIISILYDRQIEDLDFENLLEICNSRFTYQLLTEECGDMIQLLCNSLGDVSIPNILNILRARSENESVEKMQNFSWTIGQLKYEEHTNGYFKKNFEEGSEIWCLKSKLSERYYVSIFTAHQKSINQTNSLVKSLFYRYRMESRTSEFQKFSLFGFPVN